MKKVLIMLFGILMPFIAFAQTTPTNPFSNPQSALGSSPDLRKFIAFLFTFINPLMGIVVSLTMFMFFWGLIKFIRKSGEQKSHADGAKFMLWSVVALFVMVSVWGIIALAQREIGITRPLVIPILPTR